MNIGFSTGFAELGNYWGDWFGAKQIGGSERIVVEIATALSRAGHQVTVRLPYLFPPADGHARSHRGVTYVD